MRHTRLTIHWSPDLTIKLDGEVNDESMQEDEVSKQQWKILNLISFSSEFIVFKPITWFYIEVA